VTAEKTENVRLLWKASANGNRRDDSLKDYRSHFVPSDLRKFAEQRGDLVGGNESNRAYILMHGVKGLSGVITAIRGLKSVYDVYT